MTGQGVTVETYLKVMKERRDEKPEEIRDAINVYLDLWEKAIQNGVIGRGDEIGAALAKLDKKGGLYKAAESS